MAMLDRRRKALAAEGYKVPLWIGGGGPKVIPCNWLQHYENLVDPFHVVIQGSLGSAQGSYEFVSDAVEFRAITAASGTEFRRGYAIARVYDQINPGTGTVQDLPAIEVFYGPNAATAGAATLPTLPANSVALQEFAVSNTGMITLVAASRAPWVTARGGIQPVDATDVVAGAYVGQYRDHPTSGLQRWDGTVWRDAAPGLTRARIYGTATQLLSASTWTTILLEKTVGSVDTRGWYTPANGRYVIGEAGTYLASGTVAYTGNTTGRRYARVVHGQAGQALDANAQDNLSSQSGVVFPSTSGSVVPSPTVLFECAVGDWIELGGYHDVAGLTVTRHISTLNVVRVA